MSILAGLGLIALPAIAAVAYWLGRDHHGYRSGYHEGYRDGWKQCEFDARMDALYPEEERAARAEAYGGPTEVYDHEMEGL